MTITIIIFCAVFVITFAVFFMLIVAHAIREAHEREAFLAARLDYFENVQVSDADIAEIEDAMQLDEYDKWKDDNATFND